ncbi:MAG: S8 family serine peptidase, partial [Candidatus Hodarchaeales archaeon]
MRRQMIFNRNRFILLLIIIISVSGSYSRSSANFSENRIESSFLGQSPSVIVDNSFMSIDYPSELFIQEGVFQITNEEGIDEYFTTVLGLINPIPEDKGLTGENITIAILDSGINDTVWINKEKIISSHAIAPNTTVYDEIGHGTQVASIISKIAPGADLISIKITDSDARIKKEWVEEGIRLAKSLNVTIIQASIGS